MLEEFLEVSNQRGHMDIEKNVEDIIKKIDADSLERLEKTPRRVAAAYEEFFNGYSVCLSKIMESCFDSNIDDLVILKNISFESHCEHHLAPIIGHVSIGYIPNKKVIGISKLARIVDSFAHRLQLQERLTVEIAEALQNGINPKGVAVFIEAKHFCLSNRGVKKREASMITRYFTGDFKKYETRRQEFLDSIKIG